MKKLRLAVRKIVTVFSAVVLIRKYLRLANVPEFKVFYDQFNECVN